MHSDSRECTESRELQDTDDICRSRMLGSLLNGTQVQKTAEEGTMSGLDMFCCTAKTAVLNQVPAACGMAAVR